MGTYQTFANASVLADWMTRMPSISLLLATTFYDLVCFSYTTSHTRCIIQWWIEGIIVVRITNSEILFDTFECTFNSNLFYSHSHKRLAGLGTEQCVHHKCQVDTVHCRSSAWEFIDIRRCCYGMGLAYCLFERLAAVDWRRHLYAVVGTMYEFKSQTCDRYPVFVVDRAS